MARRRKTPALWGFAALAGIAWLLFGRKATAAPAPVAPGRVGPPGAPPAGPDDWDASLEEIQASQARITEAGQSLIPSIVDELILGGSVPADAFDVFSDPGLMRPIRLTTGVYAVPAALAEMLGAPGPADLDLTFNGGELF